MRTNMPSLTTIDALNKYLESDEFNSDMTSHFAEEKAKREQHIAFSKTDLFQEILQFIKDRDSHTLDDEDKHYHPEKIPFSEDDIKSFFRSFSFACEFEDYDEFEDFSTQVLYLNDFILYRMSGQGTVEHVSFVPNGAFNLNLDKKDIKTLSSSGWSFGKENGLFFAKNDTLNKSFHNKYFTLVKRYVHHTNDMNAKTKHPDFLSQLEVLGYSVVSDNPLSLVHIDSNTTLDTEDSLFIFNTINL